MTAPRRDIISGAVFGVGAIILFTYAAGFPVREGQSAAVGPGFYPKLLAVLLGVLSLIQIISSFIADRKETENLPPIWKDRKSLKLLSITLAALIAYPFAMRLIGFAMTGFIFLGVLIFALSGGSRKGKQLVVIAAITVGISVLTYLVFRVFLRIPFPTGLIRL
jgi:hypothetical protein